MLNTMITIVRAMFELINTIFYARRSLPKAQKRQSSWSVFFRLSGSGGSKAAHKLLMKLTPGLNFINVLCTAFTHVDPECTKKDSQVSSVNWRFWDLQA